ncbi:MAG: hypothetical protein HN645_03415, partial [Gemmatimonadales bacterium]|nr:hypothetical protein [Gemmatimonadales bacterium]
MRRHSALLAFSVVALSTFAAVPTTVQAQSVLPNVITDAERPRVRAVEVTEPIEVDGWLTESVWRGQALGGFIQA